MKLQSVLRRHCEPIGGQQHQNAQYDADERAKTRPHTQERERVNKAHARNPDQAEGEQAEQSGKQTQHRTPTRPQVAA